MTLDKTGKAQTEDLKRIGEQYVTIIIIKKKKKKDRVVDAVTQLNLAKEFPRTGKGLKQANQGGYAGLPERTLRHSLGPPPRCLCKSQALPSEPAVLCDHSAYITPPCSLPYIC